MKKNLIWTLVRCAFALICGATFLPFTLSPHLSTPLVLGLPRTLGLGLAVSVVLILLVALGAVFAPSTEPSREA